MLKEKILIVEDEKDLLRLLKYNLQKEGYRVIAAKDGESGLVLNKKNHPDLILLDIMLPKMDGLEFCRIVRQDTQVPIIFLTAKKSELDRILGFKLGADDYVTKPFSLEELIARIQALFRRAHVPNDEKGKGTKHFGEVEVDFERHEVRVKGRLLSLPPKEFELFKILIEANGKVLSREYLLERIWGYERSAEIDTRTVDQHIARLRRKLLTERTRIVTVSSAGYQIRMS